MASIVSITIKVKDKEYVLNAQEAKELYFALGDLLRDKKSDFDILRDMIKERKDIQPQFIPQPYLVPPPYPVWPRPYPYITYSITHPDKLPSEIIKGI